MRVKATVIRSFGKSAAVTIPKAMLKKYSFAKGDTVALRETPDGILITAYDADFAKTMKIARDASKRYHNAMRELSKL